MLFTAPVDLLPAHVPDQWAAPTTILSAFLVVGYLVREWAKARSLKRDADQRLIDNLQEECDRKDRELENRRLEIDRLTRIEETIVHEHRNLGQLHEAIMTLVAREAHDALRHKVEKLVEIQRAEATKRRIERGELPVT